jgi:hypothetical protein
LTFLSPAAPALLSHFSVQKPANRSTVEPVPSGW